MAELLDRKRATIRIRATILQWLEREAKLQTELSGGTIRQGGAGITTPSNVIEQLILTECKRRERLARKEEPCAA